MNEHLEIATYLVDRGADINGDWSLHEPATILHHVAFTGKLKVVQFLVERGADLSIRDLRYDSDALDWASYNGQKKVVDYLKKVLDH
jgi:ankyrin repeat protein